MSVSQSKRTPLSPHLAAIPSNARSVGSAQRHHSGTQGRQGQTHQGLQQDVYQCVVCCGCIMAAGKGTKQNLQFAYNAGMISKSRLSGSSFCAETETHLWSNCLGFQHSVSPLKFQMIQASLFAYMMHRAITFTWQVTISEEVQR